MATYIDSLLRKPDQVFVVTSQTASSNYFLRTGRNTGFCDWWFIHRARLDVLPLNGTKRWLVVADLQALPLVRSRAGDSRTSSITVVYMLRPARSVTTTSCTG